MVGRFVASLILAGCLLLASAALAQPTGEATFVPIVRGPPPTQTSVMVERGDHLWKISARHLSDINADDPSPGEIAPYWRRVISSNLARLRSGDADLIYPGETIVLPEVTSDGP